MKLINADCMDIMKDYKDDEFDISITSPPYNAAIGVVNGEYKPKKESKFNKKYSDFNDSLSQSEYKELTILRIRELSRVSRIVFYNIQLLTGNKPSLFQAIGELTDILKEVVIWDKCSSMPHINDGTMGAEFEFIFIFAKENTKSRQFKNVNFKNGELSNMWRIGKSRGVKGSINAATFPQALPDVILKNFAHNGDKVLDPFMGTGTTGIAAHYAKCDFTGIEIDFNYFKFAEARIKEKTRQLELF